LTAAPAAGPRSIGRFGRRSLRLTCIVSPRQEASTNASESKSTRSSVPHRGDELDRHEQLALDGDDDAPFGRASSLVRTTPVTSTASANWRPGSARSGLWWRPGRGDLRHVARVAVGDPPYLLSSSTRFTWCAGGLPCRQHESFFLAARLPRIEHNGAGSALGPSTISVPVRSATWPTVGRAARKVSRRQQHGLTAAAWRRPVSRWSSSSPRVDADESRRQGGLPAFEAQCLDPTESRS